MKRLLSSLPCLLLTACGQAGPLYLPGQEPPRQGHSLRPDTRQPSDELPPARSAATTAAPPTDPAQDDKTKPRDAKAQPSASATPDTSPTPPPVSP